MIAASEGSLIGLVHWLLNNRENVNATRSFQGTALEAASEGGHIGVLQLLLNNRANVNATSIIYGTALKAASVGDHVAVVQLLLENGANVNATSSMHGTALKVASAEGHIAVVEQLLDHGADVNMIDELGHSTLDFALWAQQHCKDKDRGDRLEAMILLLRNRGAVTGKGPTIEVPWPEYSDDGWSSGEISVELGGG